MRLDRLFVQSRAAPVGPLACRRRRVDRVSENASDYAEVGDRPSRVGWRTRIFSSARAAPPRLARQPSTDV